MQNDALSKQTVSFGLALAISSVVNALLVLGKEKSRAVQAVMQKLTGHHWVTHVTVVLLLFFAIGFLPLSFKGSPGNRISVNRLIKIIVGGISAAGVIITGFYLIAD